MTKYRLIINNHSFNKKKEKKLNLIKSLLENKIEYSITFVKSSQEAIEQSKKATEDIIIAVGGDGTIRDVLTGLINTNKTMAIIPLGTSNDYAKSINIKNIQDAVNVISNNKSEYINIGKVTLNNNEFYFNSTSGIGFDAYMLTLNDNKNFKKLKKLLGHMSYILAALFLSLKYKPTLTKITFNNQIDYNIKLFELNANFVKSMSGMKVTPHAHGKNPYLDIFMFRKVFWPKLVLGLTWYYITSKKIPYKEAEYITNNKKLNTFNLEKIDNFTIHQPIHVQLNGDFIGIGKSKFELIKNAIKIIK